jgi:hypothetical protein
VRLDVAQAAAREIVDDMHLSATVDQSIYQVGADERSSTGDENSLMSPDDGLHYWLL